MEVCWNKVAAAVPSSIRSNVSGMPNGQKWSAVGPGEAFGIHTPTCVGMGVHPRSSRWNSVCMIYVVTLHAA